MIFNPAPPARSIKRAVARPLSHQQIGSGSIILNRVTVRGGAIVAAACLVPEGFEVPASALVAGVPARIKKTGMPADLVDRAVKTYIESGRAHRAGLRRLDR